MQRLKRHLLNERHTAGRSGQVVAGIAQGDYREALQLLQHSEEDWLSLLREWMNVTLKRTT